MQNDFNIVVLISGNGSNLQAIIDAIAAGKINGRIVAVISDQVDAYGLERAESAGIKTEVLLAKDHTDRASYDNALQTCIDRYQPQLIVLAGFMRILGKALVKHFHGRVINIHPSLLPNYRGLHTHERVLEAGEKYHGTSVHFVTEELDGGPLIAQETIEITEKDTPETLKQRIQTVEHQLYPKIIAYFAEKRLGLTPKGVVFDDKLLKDQNPTCET